MAGLKQIKSRLKSVTNTRKITNAMKLVSAAKLRKAQLAVTKSREYTAALHQLVKDLSAEMGGADISHPLLQSRANVKRVRLIVVGGSRGLCGGYNTNVYRKVEAAHLELSSLHPGVVVESVLFGKKPAEYYRRVKRPILASFEALPEEPVRWPIGELCRQAELDFIEEKIDAVYLIYTKFRSAMSQTTMLEKLLPMDLDPHSVESSPAAAGAAGLTLFEPSPAAVFAAVIPRVVRSRVLQGALESKASEHGSRMTAMDAASKNANELAANLRLLRNKLRQTGITSQLLDIVGGAEALNK